MNLLIFRGKIGGDVDNRRAIKDTTLEKEITLPFPLKQVKVIDFFEEAAMRFSVGNHFHTEESKRYEFYIILGKESEEPACLFKFRKPGKTIQEAKLMAGDACLIPPGYSHAFMPLRTGIQIIGISNLEYNSAHDVPDKLFRPF